MVEKLFSDITLQSHDTSGGLGGRLVALVSIQGWFLLMDGDGLLHFPLKVAINTFTSDKVYLWLVIELFSVTAELVCLPSVCSLNLTPNHVTIEPFDH